MGLNQCRATFYCSNISKRCAGRRQTFKNRSPITLVKMHFILRDYRNKILIITTIKINIVLHYNVILKSYIIFKEWRNLSEKLATDSLSLIIF
jgi:hypothetical protein